MYAAAWLIGEFAELLPPAAHPTVMAALLHENVASLPEQVQSIYLQSALKVYVTASGAPGAPPARGGGGGDVDLLGGGGKAASEAAVSA